MATQQKTSTEHAAKRGQSDRRDSGPGDETQGDHWPKYVESLSRQFGEAIDPVLAELPQRMAKAIEANLTKNGDQVARNMPHHTREPAESGENRQNDRTDKGVSRRGDGGIDASAPQDQSGGEDMATARTTEQREARNRAGNGSEEKSSGTTDIEVRTRKQTQQHDRGRQSIERRRAARLGYSFDPAAAVRAEHVRLAASWAEAGAPYQAIHAYTQILVRYPDSGAASAAVEGLMNLAETLKAQGMYHSALGVLDKVYQLT